MNGPGWLPGREWYGAPKSLVLSDPAQGLCMLEDNTGSRVHGERHLETRSRRPLRATHHVTKATSEIPVALVRKDEVAREAEEAREANGGGEVGSLHRTAEAR